MLCKRTGHLFCCNIAGWSSLEARRAHNPKVTGSNPVSATNSFFELVMSKAAVGLLFSCLLFGFQKIPKSFPKM